MARRMGGSFLVTLPTMVLTCASAAGCILSFPDIATTGDGTSDTAPGDTTGTDTSPIDTVGMDTIPVDSTTDDEPTSDVSPDAPCTPTDIPAGFPIPCLMIVVDRAVRDGSLFDPTTVMDLVDFGTTRSDMAFGLTTFPFGTIDTCAMASITSGSTACGLSDSVRPSIAIALASVGGLYGQSPLVDSLAIATHEELLPPDMSGTLALVTTGPADCNPALEGATCTCTAEGDCATRPEDCRDDVRVMETLAGLHEAGIDTYVVGINYATRDYDSLWNDMAAAGGTDAAHISDHEGAEIDEYDEVFQDFDAKTGCLLTLSCSAVVDPMLLNFYDTTGTVIPMDSSMTQGWIISEDCSTASVVVVRFFGHPCLAMEVSGIPPIARYGCPTVVP